MFIQVSNYFLIKFSSKTHFIFRRLHDIYRTLTQQMICYNGASKCPEKLE